MVETVTDLPSSAFAGVVGINSLLAQCRGQLLQRGRFCAAQEQDGVHIADDGIGMILVECFQLALGLQNQAGGDLAGADRGHQLFKVWNLADVGRLIDQTPDMNRKPTAIHIVRLLTQQIEQLGVDHGDQEIEGGIRIGHDEKQGRLFIAQGIQLELVMGGDLPELCNIKGRKARTAGNQNGFRGFASGQFVFLILPDRKVVRLSFFQHLEHEVNPVLVVLIVLSGVHHIQKFQQSGEILFLLRGFVMDVADQRTVQELFGLHPEIVTGLALTLGVGDQGGGQLQNVFLRMDIGKGVVVHGFCEVDGVEHLDPVAVLRQRITAFCQNASLDGGNVKLFSMKIEKTGTFCKSSGGADINIYLCQAEENASSSYSSSSETQRTTAFNDVS